MKYNIGDIVEFYSQIEHRVVLPTRINYTEPIKEIGIVVGKGNALNPRTCISIKRFKGDYKVVENCNIKKKFIPIEDKLSLIASFGDWWYNTHKSLYQSILIEAIGPKY